MTDPCNPGVQIGLPDSSQIPGPTELQRPSGAVPKCGYSVVRSGSGSSGGKCRSRISAQRCKTTKLGKRLPQGGEIYGTWADSQRPAWDAVTTWILTHHCF